MSFLRPEALAALRRWREAAGFAALSAAGLWITTFGGWFYAALGLALAALGAAGIAHAIRRQRFARTVDQPGVVELDEGQLRYFGPHGGGFIALPDLVDLRLIADASGARWWRLTDAQGTVLSIPVAAAGADALFDAFAALPGLTPARLLAALDGPPGPAPVWRRSRALT